MADIVLLVFEGERTEPKIFDNLNSTIFGSSSSSIIRATYNAEIYQLWEHVKDSPFLDLVEVLRNRSETNRKALEGIERDHISRVFLFFDYDGHATRATDDKIEQMLEYFDEETENGKLYISYPMVEAFKDTTADFKNHAVPARHNRDNYKGQVAGTTIYQDPRKITEEDWRSIISNNLEKGNYIVTRKYESPSTILSQNTIFEGQLTNYIRPLDQVAVLSGIPFFIIEYFGGLPPALKRRETDAPE